MEPTVVDLACALFEAIPEALLLSTGPGGHVLDANSPAGELFGQDPAELRSRAIDELLGTSGETAPDSYGDDENGWLRSSILRGSRPLRPVRIRRVKLEADSQARELIILRPDDVTRNERFLAGQTQILEQLALGTSLKEILESIVLLIEDLFPGLRASILLVSDDRRRLIHGAAPSLHADYNQLVDGIEIGEGSGSCGAAAFRGERVVVRDTQTDPLWAQFREMAAMYSLGACWSQPVFSSTGELLGTFAMYYTQPGLPSEPELDFIEHAARLAGVSIERWQTESELKRQRRELEAILDAVQAQVVYMDTEARASWHNRLSRESLGMENESSCGSTITDQAPRQNDPELRYRQCLEVLRTGQPMLGSIEKFEESGRSRWVSVDKVPTFDDDGHVNGLLLFSYDITEIKQIEDALRQSEERFRQLAENIESAFWMFDERLEQMLYISPAYSEIFGRTPDAMYGNPSEFLELVFPQDRELVEARIEKQRLGESTELEYRIVRPDGEIRWVRDRAFPIRDESGNIIRVAGIADDITQLKRTAEKLEQHRSDLAHASRLTAMGEMAAGLAHELNQPLAAISNFAVVGEEMVSGAAPLNQARLGEILGMLRRQAARAGEILKRVGSFASQKSQLRSHVNLNAIVRDATRLVDIDCRNSDVRLVAHLDEKLPSLEADAVQIQQILVNLIRNAMEAVRDSTDPQNQRTVTVATQSRQEAVEFTVHDTGPGLGDNVSRIFEPFFTTREDGMGLGLQISRSIAEAHGGQLSASNHPDGGALFRVVLPVIVNESPESTSQWLRDV